MKRYAFIYNPAARSGRSESEIDKLKLLIDEWEEASLFRSKKKGDIKALVRQLFDGYDIFVACGGDGTIREVAAELVDSHKTLGVIPLGSGNDLCKTLQIPTNLLRAFNMLRQHSTATIDVGQCNDVIFLNVLGFGFDGLTNEYAHKLEWLTPFLRYAVAALWASFTHSRFTWQLPGNEDESNRQSIMITFANGRVEGGSFWIAPEASITDGMLNLVQIDPIPKLLIPILLPLFLLKKASWIPQVHSKSIRALSVTVDSDIAIHADGESLPTEDNSFDIRIRPSALKVICGL